MQSLRSASIVSVALLSLALLPAVVRAGDELEPLCGGGRTPHLVMTTESGTIVAQLLEAAAPRSVRRLVRLVNGRVDGSGLGSDRDGAPPAGYYDGLSFIRTRPHVEIATGLQPSEDPVELDAELDALALGLNEQRIGTAAAAMDVAQQELAPAYKKTLKSGTATPRLKEWVDRLYATHDAAFLTGISRQEINEALGYVYQRGLDSQPVTRGAVMLEPSSPRVASARLSIALAEMPQRTGRWMVVGRVVQGLDVAQEISTRPLADPGVVRSRHQPLAPVRIAAIRLECRTSD